MKSLIVAICLMVACPTCEAADYGDWYSVYAPAKSDITNQLNGPIKTYGTTLLNARLTLNDFAERFQNLPPTFYMDYPTAMAEGEAAIQAAEDAYDAAFDEYGIPVSTLLAGQVLIDESKDLADNEQYDEALEKAEEAADAADQAELHYPTVEDALNDMVDAISHAGDHLNFLESLQY